MDERIYKLDVFSDISRADLDALLVHGEIKKISAGTYHFREDDKSEHLDILLSGQCVAMRNHPETGVEYEVKTINSNNIIGGIGLADHDQRLFSMMAVTDCEILVIPKEDIAKIIYQKERVLSYLPFTQKLQKKLAEWLYFMSHERVISMGKVVDLLNEKSRITKFILYVVSILSFFSILQSSLYYLFQHSEGKFLIPLGITLFLALAVYQFSRHAHMKPEDFGISTHNIKKSLLMTCFYSSAIMLFLTIAKYISIKTIPSLHDIPLIDIRKANSDPLIHGWSSYLINAYIIFVNLTYVLIGVPLQEFVSRGVMQGFLYKVLDIKHKALASIIMSNLMFGALHSFLSFQYSVITFFLGLFFGWIYYKYKNLFCPILAHTLIGVWSLSILNGMRAIDVFINTSGVS
jgi:membrane protease YdiL (CAAX protease family)